MYKNNYLRLLTALATVIVAGCGGGSSSSTTEPPLQGAYSGTVSGSSSSSAFSALVLEDGEYWALYGNNVGGVFEVKGFLEGQGASSNGNFTSTSVLDYGVSPPASGTLNATYVKGTSFGGSVSFAAGTLSFNGTPIPAAAYVYDTAASLPSILGNWILTDLQNNPAALTVNANGAFTLNDGGCLTTGTATPRPSGINVFNIGATVGGAPCSGAGLLLNGIAIVTLLASGQHQLIIATINPSQTESAALFGIR